MSPPNTELNALSLRARRRELQDLGFIEILHIARNLFLHNGLLVLNDDLASWWTPRWLLELHRYGLVTLRPGDHVGALTRLGFLENEHLKLLYLACWMPEASESLWRLGGTASLARFLAEHASEPCNATGQDWTRISLPGTPSTTVLIRCTREPLLLGAPSARATADPYYGQGQCGSRALATGRHPTAHPVPFPAESLSCVGVDNPGGESPSPGSASTRAARSARPRRT